jgi:hypothetical protein
MHLPRYEYVGHDEALVDALQNDGFGCDFSPQDAELLGTSTMTDNCEWMEI